MHIGFDISQTGSGKAGCGYFAHAMAQAMISVAPEHCYSLYPSFGDFYFDARMPIQNPYPGGQVEYGPRHLTRETARLFWLSREVEASLGNPEIIHSNNFWSPVTIARSRLIYTFYDMGFAVDPSWTTEANRVGCYEGVFRSAIAADWVVAISQASRDHYLKTFPHFPADRVRVIYPCSRFADSSAMGSKPKSVHDLEPGAFWLNVGTIEPRKNQRRLVQAYAQYLERGGKLMPLVLAGGKGWLMDDFQQLLSGLGLGDKVRMTGYVTDDELIWLYRNCYANIYPSLFEGFGLPVLEGMQFGAPTITTTSSSVPEVAGNAAILVDPLDVDGWTAAMLRIGGNPDERDALAVRAIEQAKGFDWHRSAADLLTLYQEAVASPKRGG